MVVHWVMTGDDSTNHSPSAAPSHDPCCCCCAPQSWGEAETGRRRSVQIETYKQHLLSSDLQTMYDLSMLLYNILLVEKACKRFYYIVTLLWARLKVLVSFSIRRGLLRHYETSFTCLHLLQPPDIGDCVLGLFLLEGYSRHDGVTGHTFLKMSLSVVQLVAWSHEQPVIGWHITLIGWHSCQLSALPPAQASTLHMLSRILLVGATGTNLPSHFVQKI